MSLLRKKGRFWENGRLKCAVQHQEFLRILRNPTSQAEEPLRNLIRHASTGLRIESRLGHCCGKTIGHSKSAEMLIQKD
jgi:hypothetical protein